MRKDEMGVSRLSPSCGEPRGQSLPSPKDYKQDRSHSKVHSSMVSKLRIEPRLAARRLLMYVFVQARADAGSE